MLARLGEVLYRAGCGLAAILLSLAADWSGSWGGHVGMCSRGAESGMARLWKGTA
jgi:hypothetical protein